MRRSTGLMVLCLASAVSVAPLAGVVGASPAAVAAPKVSLLTDPFLQKPERDAVTVAWFTENAEAGLNFVVVGDGAPVLSRDEVVAAIKAGRSKVGTGRRSARLVEASSTPMTRLREDFESKSVAVKIPDGTYQRRNVMRHEARVGGLRAGKRQSYRVITMTDSGAAISATATLQPAPAKGQGMKILLTSDHQAMTNTPAAMQEAAAVGDRYDAVFYAGDLANQPDRGSEWFDNPVAWFPVLQGRTLQASTHGEKYRGGAILQHAPVFTTIGNHEVQGRWDDVKSIGESFNKPRPRAVAEEMYAMGANRVNPNHDPQVKARWIEDHSFSTRTYEELLTLPTSATGGERYYATTIGDVRLISLFATRNWSNGTAEPDPAKRSTNSRFQESAEAVRDVSKRGYGEMIFEPIKKGSTQYEWLKREVQSPAFKKAKYTVVMLHESPQSLGDNAIAPFTDPVPVQEKDAQGNVVGIRYEYPQSKNYLLHDVQPLLEKAGVDLVYSGHSHLWNRFVSTNGTTNWLEGSNTGNSYGAYHPLSGQKRSAVPPAPWNAADHPAQGNPGGLAPVVPTLAPVTNKDGVPTPFLADGEMSVFGILDTSTGTVTSYRYDVRTPDVAPVAMDRFSIGR